MIFNLFKKINTIEVGVMSTSLLIKAQANEKLLLQATKIAQDLETKLSAYQSTSEICQINQNAGIKPVKCSADTIEVLEISLEIAKATEGKFDISIGALTQGGYGFGTDHEKLLKPAEKKRLKSFVNYKDIEINKNEVYLKREGMALDVGGIGKGYAADKIIKFLKANKVKMALVSVGGEVHAYGKEWHLGVQNPRVNKLLAQLTSTKNDTLVTTSGDYERFIKDPSHNHIIQPKNAQSANKFSSLTLISNSLDAARMDALNTALFQMDEQQMAELLKKYDLATLVVDKTGQYTLSKTFDAKLKSFTFLP